MDRIVRPEIKIFGKTFSRYFFFVVVGLIAAITLAMLLTSATGASHITIIIVISLDVIVLLALAMLTKIIWGGEQYTFYHYMILVLIISPVIMNIMGVPVFPYQDIIAIVLILNLGVGRIGCLMVGCCHGKPGSWGVRYGEKHVHAGFIPLYFDVRLFPHQLLELVIDFIIVSAGIWVLLHQLPGDAFSWMIIAYGLVRYVLEYFRGDSGRPFWKSFSEAQWTSVGLILIVAGIEWTGKLPFHSWHMVVAGGTVISIIIITYIRRSSAVKRHLLLNPNHIQELSNLISRLSNDININMKAPGVSAPKSSEIKIGCTSLGIQISLGVLNNTHDFVHHYSFSGKRQAMNNETAKTLANLVIRLWYPSCNNELIDSKKGIYHLLIKKQNNFYA